MFSTGFSLKSSNKQISTAIKSKEKKSKQNSKSIKKESYGSSNRNILFFIFVLQQIMT